MPNEPVAQKATSKKRTRDDAGALTPTRDNLSEGAHTTSPLRDQLNPHTVPHKVLIEQLAASQLAMGRALVQLVEHANKAEKEAAAKTTDDWFVAVSSAMGKAFPERIKDMAFFAEGSILDPAVACDPHLLLLVMRRTTLESWVESSILPGPLLRQWRGVVAQERFWQPRCSEKEKHFIQTHLGLLETKLLELANAYFRWPENCSAATFLLEKQGLLDAALNDAKELEGKAIALRCGPKAAAQFYAAWRLGSRRCGASFSSAVAKIRTGGGAARPDDASDDEEAARGQYQSSRRRHFDKYKNRSGGNASRGGGGKTPTGTAGAPIRL